MMKFWGSFLVSKLFKDKFQCLYWSQKRHKQNQNIRDCFKLNKKNVSIRPLHHPFFSPVLCITYVQMSLTCTQQGHRASPWRWETWMGCGHNPVTAALGFTTCSLSSDDSPVSLGEMFSSSMVIPQCHPASSLRQTEESTAYDWFSVVFWFSC